MDTTKKICLARQRAAVAAGTPLSCLVNVSGPPSKNTFLFLSQRSLIIAGLVVSWSVLTVKK